MSVNTSTEARSPAPHTHATGLEVAENVGVDEGSTALRVTDPGVEMWISGPAMQAHRDLAEVDA